MSKETDKTHQRQGARIINQKSLGNFQSDAPSTYLINKLDTVVSLQRLDCHSSGIDQLCQVDGLVRVHPSQIDQVLQSFQ